MAKQRVQQNRDVHQHVTDHIIAAIEAGAGDWRMPWHRSSTSYGAQSRPVNVASGKAYQGINTVMTKKTSWRSQRHHHPAVVDGNDCTGNQVFDAPG